jgi:uncharacterized protein
MLLWSPGQGRKVAAGVGVLLGGGLVLAVGGLAEGEIARFAGAFQNVVPLVLLAVLAQLRPAWPRLTPLVWLVFGLLMMAGLALVVGATLMALDLGSIGPLPPDAGRRLLAAFGLGIIGLFGSLALLTNGLWARLAAAFGGHVERADPRHAQALVGLVAASMLAFVPTIALGGEALALRLAEIDPAFFDRDRSAGGQLLDQVYDLAWTIPLALLLVGVPLQRTIRVALVRLGIRPVGLHGIGIGIGMAAILWVAGTALDHLTYWFWGIAGWPRTEAALVERLMSAAFSPVGAVVAATAAGLGEELMMRGVLQPRFGWLLPNLAFTAAHALQYNLDALVGVFVLGAILAFVRARWSTSEAILAHALYDLVLFLGGSIAPG